MTYVSTLFLIISVLLALTVVSAEVLSDERTVDEWRSILAVDDDQGTLTGLQMTLGIEPDQYFLPLGTQVNLSGMLFNVFGPVKNAPVILAIGCNEKPLSNKTLITNENGEFSSVEMVNRTGIIRYQTWFEGTDLKDSNRTISPEIEISGISPSLSISGNETTGQDSLPEDQPVTREEKIQNVSDSEVNQSVSGKITLEADCDSFISGQNITLSGVVTSQKDKPRAHAMVSVEMGYGKDQFMKIGDFLVSDIDGTYSASFHLTGPDSPLFRAVSTDEKGNSLKSNEICLTFRSDDYNPPARIRPQTRHIDANLSPSIIQTGENITVSGWFADGNGDPISPGRLNLYWYNFADQIWDRYEPGADVITSKNGYYAINVSGPGLTGVTYVAMVSKHERNDKPLFSRALALTVRNESESIPSILPASLIASSVPDEVKVAQPARITFKLSDPTGNPLSYESIQVLFSEDGFTWYTNQGRNLTTNPEGIIDFNDTPKQPGFHYYRGVYNGTEAYGPADSGILVLAITGNDTVMQP